jgi:phage-related protein
MERRTNTDKTWEGTIVFYAADPCAYKNTADSNNHTIATDPDEITETNGGTAAVRPVITITSDADHGETTVTITSVTTGEALAWTGTFDTDDVLEIDCEEMVVKLNGTVDMLEVEGEFPQLLPGSNTIDTDGFTGTLNFTYKDRYL